MTALSVSSSRNLTGLTWVPLTSKRARLDGTSVAHASQMFRGQSRRQPLQHKVIIVEEIPRVTTIVESCETSIDTEQGNLFLL